MSGKTYLKFEKVAGDCFPLLVLAGALGAGLIVIGDWLGLELGLTKCLALVSVSISGARFPLPLDFVLVPLAGESP